MKRAFLFLIVLLLFVGLAGGLGYFQFFVKPDMIKGFIAQAPQPVNAVAAARAESANWTPRLPAIGTFRALQGVEVAPQVGGIVREIRFKLSEDVGKGAPLVQIDDSTEQADLKSNDAALRNAEVSLQRQRQLITGGNTPQANLDAAWATRDQAAAAAEHTRAIIAQKAIAGAVCRPARHSPHRRRAVCLAGHDAGDAAAARSDLCRLLAAGAAIAELKLGQTLEITVDAYPGTIFKGTVKFVEARVNADTRNVMVRGEIANPQKKLLPGMFANVNILAGTPKEVVTLPRTSISYSLYGDSVYVLTPAPQQAGEAQAAGSDQLYTIERRFVRPGDTREDKVAITEGVKPGELVVSEGQIKLQPNARVRVDPNAGLKPLSPRPRE